MERQQAVPKGVSQKVIGEHSGDKVLGRGRTMNRDRTGNDQSENPHVFTCKELVHFTENKFAAEIGLSDTIPSFSFKPSPWKINTLEENPLELTWWSPLLPNDWKKSLNENDFQDFGSIGNSPAINGKSMCGPIGFVLSWKDIMEQYAIGRQKSPSTLVPKIELRNLGTFLYIREIMFAVLVCVEGDFNDNRFPVITSDDETEAFRGSPYSDDFLWKVHGTMNRDRRTWDHLTFAFYCPKSNLSIPPQCCRIVGKIADKYRPQSRSDFSHRTIEEEWQPCKATITKLEDKIERAKNALNTSST